MKSLMNENTAYRLSIPFECRFHSRYLTEENNTIEKAFFFRAIHRNYIHPSRHLRYCPKCAAEQRNIYGEAYWSVLPHLDGYEICHIHGEPIRDSGIPLSATIYKFYPASNFIQEGREIHEDIEHLHKIDRHLGSYERHAKELNWCYRNGHTIGSYVKRIYDYAKSNIPGMKIDFSEMLLDDMVKFPAYYYELMSSGMSLCWRLISYMSHIQQIRILEIVSGTLLSESSVDNMPLLLN